MATQEDILNFLDFLALDEGFIDERLQSLMARRSYTNKQLINVLLLLKYKQLINFREGTECENTEELKFLVKLLSHLDEDNINDVCKIANITLSLNTTSILSNSQHFLTQIWSDIDTQQATITDNLLVLRFQVCDSILETLLKSDHKLDLLFASAPVQQVLQSANEKLIYNFLTATVPKLSEIGINFTIFDQVWEHIKHSKNIDTPLKILCWLADYYLPTIDNNKSTKFESEVVFKLEFWDLIQQGLTAAGISVKKMAVYLAKRAIDYVHTIDKNVEVKSGPICIFKWDPMHRHEYQTMWDNYFILLDSLEEKQSSIVLPSLQLFGAIKDIGDGWLNYAFSLGLKHDNTRVKLKCIHYKLNTRIHSDLDALTLLQALNDINLYDNHSDIDDIRGKMATLLNNTQSCVHVFKTIPLIKWSPIPFFHLSSVLSDLRLESDWHSNAINVDAIAISILKAPCNIVIVRKAIHINILYFLGNCCNNLNCSQLINIYKALQWDVMDDANPFITLLKNKLHSICNEGTLESMLQTSSDILVVLMHVNDDNVNIFIDIINNKIQRIQGIQNRPYSNKLECLEDVLFVTKLLDTSKHIQNEGLHTISTVLAREYKTILQYILSLLSHECAISVDDTVMLFANMDSVADIDDSSARDVKLHLYRNAILLLKDTSTGLSKSILCIHILHHIWNRGILASCHRQEMLSVSGFIKLINNINLKDVGSPQSGRLRNVFYEISSRFVNEHLQIQMQTEDNVGEIIDFVENVLECGGYGCLKWVLRIMNKIIDRILDVGVSSFNVTQFLKRMWREIEELKSNNQYTPCMREFITLITQESLLSSPEYNDLVLAYCVNIIEYGDVRNTPLYYLVKELNNKRYLHKTLVHVLGKVLLYSPLPRKDHRIADNLVIDILNDPKYGLKGDEGESHFNYEIHYLSVLLLANICDRGTLDTIAATIMNKLDEMFKNKQRYHGNSQVHRVLLNGVQTLLLLLLKRRSEAAMLWCLGLLGRMPHQPSVRVCLEWHIAFYLCAMDIQLDNAVLLMLESNNVPLPSQFVILYWAMRHKMAAASHSAEELELVVASLLRHTMGPHFAVRLLAQALALMLLQPPAHAAHAALPPPAHAALPPPAHAALPPPAHAALPLLRAALAACGGDEHYTKLRQDYFLNDFHLVGNMTPYFVYHVLPRYFDDYRNERVSVRFARSVCDEIEGGFVRNNSEAFKVTFERSKVRGMSLVRPGGLAPGGAEPPGREERSGPIQMKYVPWRNMGELGQPGGGEAGEAGGGGGAALVLVASLVAKAANLGGLARTAEVLGAGLVLDSRARMAHPEFRALSMSAERWLRPEEVPAAALEAYLRARRAQGWAVVAAELASGSQALGQACLPARTLLLLGHERSGVPPPLLALADLVVHVPQRGRLRSLNVHVAAALCAWEHARLHAG